MNNQHVNIDDINFDNSNEDTKKQKNKIEVLEKDSVQEDEGKEKDQIKYESKKNKGNTIKNNERNIEQEMDLNVVENKFEVPSNLKKTFCVSVTLLIVGITLFILGFVEEIAESAPGVGIAFWVLGGILLIPGGYYSYQFYKAKKSKDEDKRDDILNEIPEL